MDRMNDFIDVDSVADSSDATVYSIDSSPEIRAVDLNVGRPPASRRVHFLDDPVPIPPHHHLPIPSTSPTRSRLRQRRAERAARLDLLLPRTAPGRRRDAQTRSQQTPSQRVQAQDELPIPELPFPIYPLAPVPGEAQSAEAETARRARLQRLRNDPHTTLLWQRFHRMPPAVSASRVAMIRAALTGEPYPGVPAESSAQPNPGGLVASANRVTPPPAYAATDPRPRDGMSHAERGREVNRQLDDALAHLRKAVQDLERARRVLSGREHSAL